MLQNHPSKICPYLLSFKLYMRRKACIFCHRTYYLPAFRISGSSAGVHVESGSAPGQRWHRWSLQPNWEVPHSTVMGGSCALLQHPSPHPISLTYSLSTLIHCYWQIHFYETSPCSKAFSVSSLFIMLRMKEKRIGLRPWAPRLCSVDKES